MGFANSVKIKFRLWWDEHESEGVHNSELEGQAICYY